MDANIIVTQTSPGGTRADKYFNVSYMDATPMISVPHV